MQSVKLDRAALDTIFAHARAEAPNECCGAVVSRGGRDDVWRFRNLQDDFHRRDPIAYPRNATKAYALGQRDVERVDAARTGDPAAGVLRMIYHSHTSNGSYFSGEDRARAMFGDEPLYPEIAWLVVSDARTPGEARAFRWDAATNDFVEVGLEVV
jgi:proteasome lid subunit RPN8/RPN11